MSASLAETGMIAIRNRMESGPALSRLQAIVPRNVDPARLMRMALLAISKSRTLQGCSPDSILMSVCDAAAMGLSCGGSLGQAYLVPFKGSATLIIGYRGLMKLARQSGEISTIAGECVYEGDEFAFELGRAPNLRHIPRGETDDRKITHAYACAIFKDGGFQFVVLTKSQVDRIRTRSRASTDGPWVTDYAEMAKKTALRRLCKMLPLTAEAEEAIATADAAEFGDMIVDAEQPEAARPTADVVGDAIATAKAKLATPAEPHNSERRGAET